ESKEIWRSSILAHRHSGRPQSKSGGSGGAIAYVEKVPRSVPSTSAGADLVGLQGLDIGRGAGIASFDRRRNFPDPRDLIRCRGIGTREPDGLGDFRIESVARRIELGERH